MVIKLVYVLPQEISSSIIIPKNLRDFETFVVVGRSRTILFFDLLRDFDNHSFPHQSDFILLVQRFAFINLFGNYHQNINPEIHT